MNNYVYSWTLIIVLDFPDTLCCTFTVAIKNFTNILGFEISCEYVGIVGTLLFY